MPLSIGQVLNSHYRIDALLGQGGMGAVYRAVDLNLNPPVAVKENLDASPEAQKRFGREAGILARLSHPNLPRVTDYFFISGQGQYLVMDYVEGEDLRAMLGRLGVLPESQLLNWVSQVCDALAYLHSQPAPIFHRDIKPGNIKIRSDGRAILVDFGIAKIYDPYLSTTIGAKAVTPGYSPPEQYGGDTTDARLDIYALGATVYHLLTGQVLPESVQRAVGVATVAPPRQLNRQISPVTEQAILKAIEVATDRRFQNVNELRAAFIQPVTRKAMAPPPPPVVATARAGAKEKFVPGAAMRLGVFVVGGVMVLLVIAAVIRGAVTSGAADATVTPTVAAIAVLPTATLAPSETPAPPTETPTPVPPTQTAAPTATGVPSTATLVATLAPSATSTRVSVGTLAPDAAIVTASPVAPGPIMTGVRKKSSSRLTLAVEATYTGLDTNLFYYVKGYTTGTPPGSTPYLISGCGWPDQDLAQCPWGRKPTSGTCYSGKFRNRQLAVYGCIHDERVDS